MAIPPTTPEAITAAIDQFDREVRDQMSGWEQNGNYEYALIYEGRRYPPKRIISMATGVPTASFSGGPQANSYLQGYGFNIEPLQEAGNNAVLRDRWAEFVHWARRFYERPEFKKDETEYKLFVARRLAEARRVLQTGQPDWLARLRAAFGPPDNLTPWQVHDRFLKWASEHPDEARTAVAAAWADDQASDERIDRFLNSLPVDVIAGRGQRLVLASFLQGAVDAHQLPVYRPEAVRAAYRLIRSDPEEEGASGGQWYLRFLSFLDALIQEAESRDVHVADRLDAQGLMWSVVHVQPPSNWSLDEQRALVRFRGGAPEDSDFRGAIGEILAEYASAREAAPFSGNNPVIGAFKRAVQSLQASGAIKKHPHVLVSYSAGQGNWAKIPWIALMDDRVTRTTQRGIYCVYLFAEDLSGVYLTLNQGVTEPKRQLGPKAGRDFLRANVSELRKRVGTDLTRAGYSVDDAIDLETSSTLGSDYEASTVAYRFYPRTHVPDSAQLAQELEFLIDTYESKVVTPDQPEIDLAVVASEFSSSLIAANVDFGSRHDELIRTFLSSLLTRPLVILTGLSGSGKSQLAIKLGEWLGEGQALIVPVRPDWTGPEALLGYVDILQANASDGRRVWSVPDVLELLLRAAQDPAHPYVLVLDEMNLAHVERYFADFLSGMESGKPVLPNVVKEGDKWLDAPGDSNPLAVPRNLFVVGTVNVDETTYMFSPKVLDRSNVLEFRVATEDLTKPVKPEPLAAAGELSATGLVSAAISDSWQDDHPSENAELFTTALRALHIRLARHDAEYGYRTFYDARRFLSIFSAMGGGTWMDALDLQVMQKVLPRLHGSRRRLEPVLQELCAFCTDVSWEAAQSGTKVDPLGSDNATPQLPRSWAKLRRMLVNLRANQFASFME